MDHYQEIHLLPDPEFVPPVLMNALFGKLHSALVELRGLNIGVSFPGIMQARSGLGNSLRLHGSAGDLEQLLATGWLTGLLDHATVGVITVVPTIVDYRVVRRVQVKSSPERLRRRWIRRKGMSQAQACLAIPDSVSETLTLPYVTIRSLSTGQTFRLFIEHRPLQPHAVVGTFSRYGLSPVATVPWF